MEHKKHKLLLAPDTGGRVVMKASSKTPVQVCHLDYSLHENTELPPGKNIMDCPHYFAIVAGREGAPLWLAEGLIDW